MNKLEVLSPSEELLAAVPSQSTPPRKTGAGEEAMLSAATPTADTMSAPQLEEPNTAQRPRRATALTSKRWFPWVAGVLGGALVAAGSTVAAYELAVKPSAVEAASTGAREQGHEAGLQQGTEEGLIRGKETALQQQLEEAERTQAAAQQEFETAKMLLSIAVAL